MIILLEKLKGKTLILTLNWKKMLPIKLTKISLKINQENKTTCETWKLRTKKSYKGSIYLEVKI